LHVFGHVHVGAGRRVVYWDEAQRAYERGMARQSKGLIQQGLDVFSWIALVKVAFYGTTGLIWNRIWGGQLKSTTMINAALMYNNTGRLHDKVQVIDI
jgi:hypothetical protein